MSRSPQRACLHAFRLIALAVVTQAAWAVPPSLWIVGEADSARVWLEPYLRLTTPGASFIISCHHPGAHGPEVHHVAGTPESLQACGRFMVPARGAIEVRQEPGQGEGEPSRLGFLLHRNPRLESRVGTLAINFEHDRFRSGPGEKGEVLAAWGKFKYNDSELAARYFLRAANVKPKYCKGAPDRPMRKRARQSTPPACPGIPSGDATAPLAAGEPPSRKLARVEAAAAPARPAPAAAEGSGGQGPDTRAASADPAGHGSLPGSSLGPGKQGDLGGEPDWEELGNLAELPELP